MLRTIAVLLMLLGLATATPVVCLCLPTEAASVTAGAQQATSAVSGQADRVAVDLRQTALVPDGAGYADRGTIDGSGAGEHGRLDRHQCSGRRCDARGDDGRRPAAADPLAVAATRAGAARRIADGRSWRPDLVASPTPATLTSRQTLDRHVIQRVTTVRSRAPACRAGHVDRGAPVPTRLALLPSPSQGGGVRGGALRLREVSSPWQPQHFHAQHKTPGARAGRAARPRWRGPLTDSSSAAGILGLLVSAYLAVVDLAGGTTLCLAGRTATSSGPAPTARSLGCRLPCSASSTSWPSAGWRSCRRAWQPRLLPILGGIGVGAAVIFVGLQAVVLRAWCPYCLVADAAALAIGLRVLWPRGRQPSRARVRRLRRGIAGAVLAVAVLLVGYAAAPSSAAETRAPAQPRAVPRTVHGNER